MRFAVPALLLAISTSVSAQTLSLPRAAATDSVVLAAAMPDLARRVMPRWQNEDRDSYLNTLFRLQLVAGQFSESNATLAQLRELRRPADSLYSPVEYTQYQLYSTARMAQDAHHYSFAEGARAAFDSIYLPFDDRRAYRVNASFGFNLAAGRQDLERGLNALAGQDSLSLRDAVALIRSYQVYLAYRALVPIAPALIGAEQQRRYTLDDSILVRSRDGTLISAIVARPRNATGKLSTIFYFTIYASGDNYDVALEAAANGYAGVVANTRGKRRGSGPVVPYEHDGDDAYDVIDWISHQAWSDGKVGMYGGSYDGFAQWAAAKQLHPALKTIVPSAAVNPGWDAPSENGIFESFQFSWIPYVSNNHLLDDAVYQDRSRWAALDSIWYATGRAYRSLDSIDGTPSPIFQRWLDHQGYDAYWQAMTPQGAQYAQLTIPVLSTTGYFDGAQAGALRYVRERMRITPNADQYLLIGPWDHFGSQRRPSPFTAGYRVDPVALLDIHAITYQWFDHILRGGPRPAILADRFNFQVMGTNTWQHSATLAGMSNDSMTLYLTGQPVDGRYQLARRPGLTSIRQTVDLKDRTTSTDNSIHDPLADTTINTTNGLVFVSDPLTAATTITGSFTGLLRAVINKKDMDLGVQLYELTERGEYFQLSFFLGRASMARDRTRRQLLAPGVLQSIPIGNTRMVSAELPKGSRLVVVVNVNKDSQTPINYGTGKDVSRETIADAGVPLQIRWSGRSYIKIPIRR